VPDGAAVPVIISASPLGVGDPGGLCLIVTDLTLQKRSETLAADERLARSVLEHVTEAVVVCDAEGRVIRMSEEAARLVGHAPPLARFADVFPLELTRTELASTTALVRAALDGRRVRGVDGAMDGVDGRHHGFIVAAGPLWGPDQRVIGCIIVLTDLTEYRRIQEGLRASQRMDSIGRLAGGMAHEINNQMTVVLGFAAFALAEQGLPPTLSEDIVQIHRAAERAASITRQLLAFSRRQLLQPTVRSLNELLQVFEPVLRRVMPDSVTLTVAPAAEPDLVRIDAGQFEQVMLNLVLNAFDAMPDGGEVRIETGNVTVEEGDMPRGATATMAPGPYVCFTVIDSGPGIPPELMEHLFEPFFTTKPIGKGTGLGLSTVYGIVKQSGGYVWSVSEAGRGASFDVYLPAAVDRGTADAGRLPAPARAATGQHILVVEDESAVRSLAARALREAGYVVHEAADGLDALERVAALPTLQLVVADLAMPRMGGKTLALRLHQSHPALPVLMMSGLPSENGQRAGMQGEPSLLQKPFAPDTLVAAVRDALRDGRLTESRGQAESRP
jgi:signal transduction histidine kinase/ActR/RegA family two-component response regulator